MSTILKALKRLDEQRRSELSPRSLEEQVLAGGAQSARSPRRRWAFVAGGAGVAALAAVGAWLTLREPHTADVAATAPAPAVPAPAFPQPMPARADAYGNVQAPRADDALPEAAPEPASPALPPAAAPPLAAQPSQGLRAPRANERGEEGRAPLAPERTTAARRAQAPASPAAPATTPSATRTRAPASTPESGVASAPTSEPAPASHAFDSDAASVASEAAPEVPAAASAAVEAPAPSLRVERTQWHPTPEKRSAWVRVGDDAAARELHEGDAVDGFVVEEIRPSGVVFLRDGKELRRGVGES